MAGRISPERPTSPARQILSGMAPSSLDDKMAHKTAKSMEGTSTFIPPVMFKNTSFAPSLNPHLFSKTASNMFNLRKSNPVALLWGVPYTAELTSACISMSMGRIPSTVAEIAVPLNGSSF